MKLVARRPAPVPQSRALFWIYAAICFISLPQSAAVNDPPEVSGLSALFETIPPYYVYENMGWQDASWHGVPLDSVDLGAYPYIREWTRGVAPHKHGDDYFFAQAALLHPKRVFEPAQAKLFIVPTLFNMVYEGGCNTLNPNSKKVKCTNMSSFVNRVCVNEICCTHGDDSCKVQHYIKVNSLLTESPWFQRSGGSDHIIVLSHFGIPQFLREHSRPATDGSPGINVSAILACNRVAFEDRDYLNRWHDGKLDQTHYTPYPGLEPVPKWRLDPNLNSGLPVNLPTLYVGTECTATPLSERNKSFAFVGKVGNPNWANAGHMARLKMCDTFAANDNPFRSTATCSGKGYKKQCKSRLHRIPGIKCSGLSICSAFQGSKYGLHVQGDSPTSNRLIDIIASELVPVFTGGEIQYDLLPFQELIPWKELSERAYMTEHTPSKMWVNVLESFAYDDARYERKLKLVQAYKEYLTWKPGNFKPFEMYMVEFYFRLAQLQQDQNPAKELRSRMARFQKHRDKLGERAYA